MRPIQGSGISPLFCSSCWATWAKLLILFVTHSFSLERGCPTFKNKNETNANSLIFRGNRKKNLCLWKRKLLFIRCKNQQKSSQHPQSCRLPWTADPDILLGWQTVYTKPAIQAKRWACAMKQPRLRHIQNVSISSQGAGLVLCKGHRSLV